MGLSPKILVQSPQFILGGLADRLFGDVQARSRHFGHQDLIWGSVTVVLDHHALNASRLRQRDGERLGIMTAVILSRV